MINFKKLSVSIALLLVGTVSLASPPKSLHDQFQKLGNVKEVKATNVQGVYAWILEKNGKTLVVYNTPDNKHFIKGSIYELNSKKNITNQDALDSLKYASNDFRDRVLRNSGVETAPIKDLSSVTPTASPDSIGFMNLKWGNKQIPEALTLIDSLAGAKEGSGLPQDTLYIFYDPNCPWCHKAYSGLREYVQKGYTVKWLPTNALGKSEQSLALAAAPLQKPSLLGPSFDKDASARNIKPTEKNLNDLAMNMQFLMAYFKKVIPDQQTSVPLAVFLDKTTGKVTHIQGLPDRPVLDILFGER